MQTISSNNTGGTDVTTHKYDFSGKLLSSYVVNHNSQSTVTPETRVLTENLYDAAGRLKTVAKTLNDVAGTKRTISNNTYDELGRLKTKVLGNSLETLTYDYNIRGWLRGINRSYANGSGSNYFGMELNYDYGFTQNQYNGNIAGERWRTSGDGERRAYGFTYDAADRLAKGDFSQYTGSAWGTGAGVDYTVSNLAYDANGNIKTMKQMGLITTTSGTVDNLTYTYRNSGYSNQLDYVADNGGTTSKLGDFKDAHTGAGDYSYDGNGNLKKDLNKAIAGIAYNHLNLPETVDFGSKGNIKFVYDAAGNKLQKIVTDKTQTPNIVTTTNYVDGFVYQHIGSTAQDTLQFFPTEEGRVRYVPAHGTTAAAYTYDYFLKDHLGNIRVVLTEQTDFTQYMATMEQPNVQKEDALFYNLDNTRDAKPADYPEDNTTTPNAAVAKLNGSDPNKRIGPSIILKVMAGDTIQAAVRAFYRQQATPKNNASLPAEQILAGLVQALVAPATPAAAMHDMRLSSPAQASGAGLSPNDLQGLKQKDLKNINNNKPKAYLNYVFFDKEFKFVEDGSGVKQVDGEPGELETLSSGKVVARKNGYVYVYTSNESGQDMLFDNLGVEQITGPVLEETHYYPFGLTMSGISSKAVNIPPNKYNFNGKEMQNQEFSDGSGWETYDFRYRFYDMQLGRFFNHDRLADKFAYMSPYQFCSNNPIWLREIDGLEGVKYTELDKNGKKRTVVEKNVVVLTKRTKAIPTGASQKQIKKITKQNNRIEKANAAKIADVESELNAFYNGSDGRTMDSKGNPVSFKFNVTGVPDIDKKGMSSKQIYAAYSKISRDNGMAAVSQFDNKINLTAPASVLTNDQATGGVLGNTTAGRIMRANYGSPNGTISHEVSHTLGLDDNGYMSGGILNSPPELILPSEVDEILKQAYDKK